MSFCRRYFCILLVMVFCLSLINASLDVSDDLHGQHSAEHLASMLLLFFSIGFGAGGGLILYLRRN